MAGNLLFETVDAILLGVINQVLVSPATAIARKGCPCRIPVLSQT